MSRPWQQIVASVSHRGRWLFSAAACSENGSARPMVGSGAAAGSRMASR